jgi:hypothetical protein
MRPCVTGDLVTVTNHAADQARPWGCRIVNGAFTEIATCDVECCFDIVAFEQIKQILSVGIRTIIIRYSNITISITPINRLSVRNASNLWPRNICRIGSSRSHIRITARAVLYLTRRCRAVEIACSTPTWPLSDHAKQLWEKREGCLLTQH